MMFGRMHFVAALTALMPLTASAASILGYEIIDTDKQAVAQKIDVQSTTWNWSRASLPRNFNIRVVTATDISMVRSQLQYDLSIKLREDGSNYQRDDKKAPFAISSETDGVYKPILMQKSKYQLRVYAFKGTSILESKTIVINISSTSPTPSPTPKPTATAAPSPAPRPTATAAPVPAPTATPKPSATPAPVAQATPAPSTSASTDLGEFPGSNVKGGSGGTICKVNTLADDTAPGSLRYCVGLSGPKVVVFEVGGVIHLLSTLNIPAYTTIAGQTAPEPGITLLGNTLRVQGGEVLVQHIRVRLGDKSGQRDAVEVLYMSDLDPVTGKRKCNKPAIENVRFDHVSLSWAIDGTFDTQNLGCPGMIRNIALTNSIVSEHLNNSVHGEGPHSFASLIGYGTHNISLLRNVYAHNNARNPRIDSDVKANIINNFVYNVGWHGLEVRNASAFYSFPTTLNYVGNAQAYSSEGNKAIMISIQSRYGFVKNSLYLKDNLTPGTLYKLSPPNSKPADEPLLQVSDLFSSVPVLDYSKIKVLPSSEVRSRALANSGARPLKRDVTDQRLINDMINGRGRVIDTPPANEWDALMQKSNPATATYRAFPSISNPWVDSDGNGRSNFEDALQSYTKQVSN